ncbi:MAG: hypothetical protein IJG34_00030 [Synergistaceae bacterium]|nr:hypothetical protein [Synergistaceae bacterium]MBQ3694944.1 hypothetical protein [Synergistaceae bacterium]MBQ6110816.1 hypothetical protein [Synergistaceae bacterium]MBQ9628515.1 hypothetical protein [Synergistaceae bacterium]
MYTRELTVLPSDASCQGSIKLRSLLDYFQDTAELAVMDIEGSATELAAKGYAWVLTKYEIDFTGRLPVIDEKFFIHTFHDPSHGYNTLRVFQVESQNGTPVVYAKTSWLLLDLAAGRPVKAIAHIPGISERDTESINPEFKEIAESENVIQETERHVKFHELDYNSHVNNAVYFEWIFDETPVDFITHELKSVYASFRSGAKFNEKVMISISKSESQENTFMYKIMRENVKKPGANFMCVWKLKKEE